MSSVVKAGAMSRAVPIARARMPLSRSFKSVHARPVRRCLMLMLLMMLLLLAVPCRLPPWVPVAAPGFLGSIFWRMRLKSGSGLVIHRLNNLQLEKASCRGTVQKEACKYIGQNIWCHWIWRSVSCLAFW